MSRAELTVRRENVQGSTIDLANGGSLSLGELARIIGGDRRRVEYIRKGLTNGDWFAASLPPILEELARFRNPAAHGGSVAREDVVRWRNRLIGLGQDGNLLELAYIKLKQ